MLRTTVLASQGITRNIALLNIFKYVTPLLLLLTSITMTRAQSNPPLIAARQGELYAIAADGQVTQLTTLQSDSLPAQFFSQEDIYLSPDGTKLLYRSVPEFFMQAVADNLTGNLGELPSDLTLLDLTTLETTPIAVHEPNTRWNEEGRLYYRSRWGADWSPDSTQIAYLEARGYNEPTNFLSRLVVYDVTSGESRVLAENTQNSVGTIIEWNENGILVDTTHYNPIDGTASTLFLNGRVAPELGIHGYVRHDGRDYLALFNFDVTLPAAAIALFDVLTGEYFTTEAIISTVSAVSPENSIIFADDTNDTRPNAVYNLAGDLLFTQSANPPYAVDFSISPDGQQFAYMLVGEGGGGSVIITDAQGNTQPLEFSAAAINWGAQQYILYQPTGTVTIEPTALFDTTIACGTLAPVGLVAGGQGRVLEGSPNRIRSAPSTEAENIGQIPAGAAFEVIDGQQGVCVDGIRWAQISYEGVTGWTAEGADGSAFVEPLN